MALAPAVRDSVATPGKRKKSSKNFGRKVHAKGRNERHAPKHKSRRGKRGVRV